MEKLIKIKDYMLEMAFLALIVRIAILGAGIGDAIAILAVVASLAFGRYLNKAKIEKADEIDKKIEDLASQVQSLKIDKAIRRSVNETQTSQPAAKRIF